MPQCNNPLFPQEDLKDPEPSGDKLQIYPQGIYDDFPKDGVTVVFGPDLKQRISVAIGNNCHTDLTSCRERLMPILHNTDLHTHTKRFILITAFVIGDVVASVSYLLSVAAAAAAGAGTGAWLASEVPAVRLSYSDLAQIHDLGKADKIAIQQGTDATPTIIVVPAMSEAPTPTGPDFIIMETLTADSDIAKKGDIVYHIPTDAARRIQDFLAMFGVKSLVDSCEGHDLFNPQKSRVRRGKRANTIEECLRQLNNFNAEWIEAVPQNVLQLAPENEFSCTGHYGRRCSSCGNDIPCCDAASANCTSSTCACSRVGPQRSSSRRSRLNYFNACDHVCRSSGIEGCVTSERYLQRYQRRQFQLPKGHTMCQ
jgi:hypothetical protein